MKTLWQRFVLCLLMAIPPACAAGPVGVQPLELTVDGLPRTALVYVPATLPTEGVKIPLIFVFHGHGGSSANALGGFGISRLWPDAISVYPQGLPTPGKLTDPEGLRSGWQNTVGGQSDRDLHFFDALLARLQKDYPVDPTRIYCTGHSNGAGFTYLLWKARPEVFAAFAPCSGAASYVRDLPPKPAIILGGDSDPLVKSEWQRLMMLAVQKLDGCEETGAPWEGATLYPSKTGTPLATFIYPGGHAMVPPEAPLIVKFFQQHPGADRVHPGG